MVTYAKANPGKLKHGMPGPTDIFALYMGAVKSRYGINTASVPYKSSPAYHQALVVNAVQLAFTGLGNAVPLLILQMAKALAVSGATRHRSFPNVPTFSEAGVPAIAELKFMMFAGSRTPRAVIDKLNAAYLAALQQPEIKTRLTGLNVDVVASTPAALGTHLASSLERYARIARSLGIKPQ